MCFFKGESYILKDCFSACSILKFSLSVPTVIIVPIVKQTLKRRLKKIMKGQGQITGRYSLVRYSLQSVFQSSEHASSSERLNE